MNVDDWSSLNVSVEPARVTDAQNAGDASLAGPALAKRINLAAILIPYSPVLAHRQPLAISRGYSFVASSNYALAIRSIMA